MYKIDSTKKNDKISYKKKKRPGFAIMSIKSTVGLRAATASAKAPPKDSPSKYIGLFGDKVCSVITISSTILIKP